MKVALLQLLPGRTADESARIGAEACARAKSLGADIALFPEMWSCGYTVPDDPARLAALALPPDGAFVRRFGELAAGLDLAILITFLEQSPEGPRNSAALFDRRGRHLFTYAKVHTCDFEAERHLARGDGFHVADLETPGGTVRAGCMICYDREFPESARILMLKGAELILVPNACHLDLNRQAQLRARAFENMLAVATCNYPRGLLTCNGRSSLFDGVARLPGGTVWRDTCALEAGAGEGICLAEFDLDALRAYRAREYHADTYRRPALYGLLAQDVREAPFLRDDYRA